MTTCWLNLHKVDFKAMIPKLWLKYPMGVGKMSVVYCKQIYFRILYFNIKYTSERI
jgi:hypothetical protein